MEARVAILTSNAGLTGFARMEESGELIEVRSEREFIPKGCRVRVFAKDFSGLFLIERA